MDIVHLSIKLDTVDTNNAIKAIIKQIKPEIEPEDLKFLEFNEGISNKLVGCRPSGGSDKDIILFRLYGNKTELFIDRKQELETFRILHAKGYGPPVFATFENGICYGFVVGGVLDTDTICDSHISALIARHMAELHAIALDGSTSPTWYNGIVKFLDIMPDEFSDETKNSRFKEQCPSKVQLLAEADMLKGRLEKHDSPIVFSHNDLLCKNIVYNKALDSVHVIDYEYANPNPLAYDIGNHFCEYAGVEEVHYHLYPKKDHQVVFLKNYLKKAAEIRGEINVSISDDEIEKLYVQVNQFALAAHFFWGVWGLVQAHYSEIDFDFLGYAIIRLNEYFKRKNEFLALSY